MAHNNYFQFKQFKIIQEKASMKVNTDGVLLGAWINIDGAKTVLDVGAGTGLISLMIAQRSEAVITGVEIEKYAAEEAFQNVKNSKWSSRIVIQNCSFQDFAASTESKFDIIVSNPPFFSNSLKNANPNLSIARHNHLLPFTDIIRGAKKMQGENGKLGVILPFNRSDEFIDEARKNDLFLTRLTRVKPFSDKEPNRCLMEFGSDQKHAHITELTIYDELRKEYSKEFEKLIKNFYLRF